MPPALNVKPFKFNEVVANVNAVVPKLTVSKILAVANVATAVPLPVSVRLGATCPTSAKLLPTQYALVMAASAVNPPEPVQENPRASLMASTPVPAVGCTNAMLPEPNATLRGIEAPPPVESNMPVVNVKLAKFNVPRVNVVVAVAAVLRAPARVVVPELISIVNAAIVLPFGVTVPVPRMLAVSPV